MEIGATDKEVAERVARTSFGEDVVIEVRRVNPTRDTTTLREILSLSSDVIGVATGILFAINYLRSRASTRDAAVKALRDDIETLPPDKKNKGNRIIDAVRDELSK